MFKNECRKEAGCPGGPSAGRRRSSAVGACLAESAGAASGPELVRKGCAGAASGDASATGLNNLVVSPP